MCFQVYLGSRHECAEIPYSEQGEHIFVRQPHTGFAGLLAHVFSPGSPYLYHVGVLDCGCGLPEGYPVGEHQERSQIHHRQLGEYLGQCLQNGEPLEMFSCWQGDEHLPLEKHRQITLQEFLAPEFFFGERQLTVVHRDQSSLQAAKGAINPVDPKG